MAIYLGGDRDDNNNYSSNDWKKKSKTEPNLEQVPNLKKGITIPIEFDVDYYYSKQQSFGKYSLDYWEWAKFKSYSVAVFEFYRQVASAFYAKYPPVDEKSIPSFINLDLKPKNLDALAGQLKVAEAGIAEQFSRSNRTVKGKINKNSPLRRLREHASNAWILFNALKQNLYVDEAIKFKKSYSNFDFNNNVDVLKAYRGAKIMKYHTSKVLSTQLLTKNFKLNEIYEDVNGLNLYNNILQTVGGFSIYDYDIILDYVFEKIVNLKEDKQYVQLIEIYEHYEDINNLIDEIVRLANIYYGGRYDKYGLFIDDFGNDLYLLAENICKDINTLQTSNLDSLFVKDMKKIKSHLDNALDFASIAYQNSNKDEL